jgi:T4 RnlA family RNA ligase
MTYNIYDNIPSYEEFLAASEQVGEEKDVFASRHGDNGYVVFKYSKNASFARRWNPVAYYGRGIIFDELDNNRLVCLPFPKFFNLDETQGSEEYAHLSRLPASIREAEVLFKEDGSMISVFLGRDGELMTSTPGSTCSEQSLWAKNWLVNHPSYEKMRGDFRAGKYRCLVMEAVYPGSKMVLSYTKEELILIAAQIPGEQSDSWIYANHSQLREIASSYDVTCVKQYQFDDIAQLRQDMKVAENLEGFVLHFPNHNGFRVKVKSDWYVAKHRTIGNVHPNLIYDVIQHGSMKNVNQYEEFHARCIEAIVELEEEFRSPFLKAMDLMRYFYEEQYINSIESSLDLVKYELGIQSLSELPRKDIVLKMRELRIEEKRFGDIFRADEGKFFVTRMFVADMWEWAVKQTDFSRFSFEE